MSPLRVLAVFLGLGCRSFGGPIAHLALFRSEFVERRAWLSERAYADLVALCQFLPGPTSSQVGMALGWRQAGLAGLVAAWLGFTLPGATVMIAAGLWLAALAPATAAPWIHGMKISVLAIVAAAAAAMWRQLCPHRAHGTVALLTAAAVLLAPAAWLQLPILALAGLAGWWLPPREVESEPAAPAAGGRTTAIVCLLLLALGLIALPLLAGPWARTAADLFRTGSLVVGGGHVVLPLLAGDVVASGRLPSETLLAGYGLAQAIPGPMFSIAGYLGAALHGGALGGILGIVCIFLPGALLLLATLPAWERLRRRAAVRRIADGLCAGVVGLLIAALYDPVAVSAIHAPADAALACVALAAVLLKVPAWAVVAGCATVVWGIR